METKEVYVFLEIKEICRELDLCSRMYSYLRKSGYRRHIMHVVFDGNTLHEHTKFTFFF
jgi:hypothetical protein